MSGERIRSIVFPDGGVFMVGSTVDKKTITHIEGGYYVVERGHAVPKWFDVYVGETILSSWNPAHISGVTYFDREETKL